MKVLAIDTVTEMCSVALRVDDRIIERQSFAPNQHSNIVLGMVDELLTESGLELSELDLLVCDVGPGSFTGIRIGVGVAQGLAYGADLPVLGVDSLSVLAEGVRNHEGSDILAAIDARMGQIYWAKFTRAQDRWDLVGQLGLDRPEDIPQLEGSMIGTGSGWDEYGDVLSERLQLSRYEMNRFPLAVSALEMAAVQQSEHWVSAGELKPVYVRNDVAKVSRKKLVN